MQWHPDKNSAPDAEARFRQIAGIYEVLKTDDLRKKYAEVLEFGLPNWRTPVFYYRTVRRMPIWELIIILMLTVTTCQYLMLWGSYVDRRWKVVSCFRVAKCNFL